MPMSLDHTLVPTFPDTADCTSASPITAEELKEQILLDGIANINDIMKSVTSGSLLIEDAGADINNIIQNLLQAYPDSTLYGEQLAQILEDSREAFESYADFIELADEAKTERNPKELSKLMALMQEKEEEVVRDFKILTLSLENIVRDIDDHPINQNVNLTKNSSSIFETLRSFRAFLVFLVVLTFSGCFFDKSGIAPPDGGNNNNHDAATCVGNQCPDAGDGQVPNPDGGDAGDGSVTPDAGPDAGDAQITTETNCGDGLDNDGDGDTDCADSDCNGKACGPECECGPDGDAHETVCTLNSPDGDSDGYPNCADIPDCDGQSCGPECECGPDGDAHETNCSITNIDRDGDGNANCADDDCYGESCGVGCACDMAGNATEDGSPLDINSACYDGIDNDGDGFTDRMDGDCQGNSTCNVACGPLDDVLDPCLTNCLDCPNGYCNENKICVTEDPPCH